MRFRTEVKVKTEGMSINHTHSLLLMGSCFVEHIGTRLKESKFDVQVNPYGVLYNPMSIAFSLKEILEGKQYQFKNLFNYQGLWHSSMHHSVFSNESKSKVLEDINKKIKVAHDFLKQMDVLIITFGSAWVYHSKNENLIVGNCHKLPESSFCRRRVEVNEIIDLWNVLIESLIKLRPSLKLIFTVSPIRHIRDGLHENQLSKSTLLLAIDELQKQWGKCIYYFPAYEILLDELRDYRFFADDMCHPSSIAIDYIWEKFIKFAISSDSQQLMAECQKINKSLNHRPFDYQSKEHQLFLRNLLLKIEELSKRYPNLAFNKEIELCHTQLI